MSQRPGIPDAVTIANGMSVRLGARLRHAREQRQLSLGDVSERTGLSRGFLSRKR